MSTFTPKLPPPGVPPSPNALVFAFADRKILVYDRPGNPLPRFGDLPVEPLRYQHLGTLSALSGAPPADAPPADALPADALPVISAELAAHVEAPEGMAFRTLRGFLLHPPDAEQARLAGRAVQIMEWDRDHQFCGRCGAATECSEQERSRRCPSCGLVAYPRVAPAVIVLVTRDGGREVLLARSPHFPPGMYSTLAGFVEPGETLDECVVREIREEVGVTVGEVRYFGSQPWPFPHSLMLGFFAEYLHGELAPDEQEIEDAAWYPWDALPEIPPRISIARALIDAHRARMETHVGTDESCKPRPHPANAPASRGSA